MRPERIAELRALEAAATPGPWEPSVGNGFGAAIEHTEVTSSDGRDTRTTIVALEIYRPDDARFLIAARTALPEALDRIVELERNQLPAGYDAVALAREIVTLRDTIERVRAACEVQDGTATIDTLPPILPSHVAKADILAALEGPKP